MARRSAIAALLLVAAAASLNFTHAGVRTAKLDYPGTTGAFPTACGAGQNENADGAPSPDIKLSDKRVAKKVAGDRPEQLHLTHIDASSVYVSWTTGDASYTYCGDGAKDGDIVNACFHNLPKAQKTGSEVRFSPSPDLKGYRTAASSGSYESQVQYMQRYGSPNNGNNYTSPIIHHVKLTGLKPETTYYYRVGADNTFSATKSFKTLPAPGKAPGKPSRIAVLADVGTTEATDEVLKHLEANKPDVVFLAGDHCYADNHGNDQRYWDAWFRLLEPSTSTTPWQIALGNHEEETQLSDCLINALAANGSCGSADQIRTSCPGVNCPCYFPKDGGLEKGGFPPEFVWKHCPNQAAFTSALARWTTPYEESGSPSPHFYSFKFGLVHAIVLSPYEPFCGGSLPCSQYYPDLGIQGVSQQYAWLAREITKIDRKKTPWVIAYFHNPWYTTFGGFKTDDCTRQALEPLLKAANVDFIFNGHIHAYERSNPVFNWHTSLTNQGCDPVHIVVGDAGNDETLTCGLVDEGLDAGGKLDCTGQQIAQGRSEGYYFSCTSHTFQDGPEYCQKNDVRVNTTAIPASYYGCQEAGYCPNKQPIYSAFRSAAYGSGLLEIIDARTAKWSWDGFFKQGPNSRETKTSEKVTFTRCSADSL